MPPLNHIKAAQVFKENMDLFEDEVKEEMERGNNPLEFPGLKFTQTADSSHKKQTKQHLTQVWRRNPKYFRLFYSIRQSSPLLKTRQAQIMQLL